MVEVCVSSRSYDLGPKKALYQRVGVPEFVAVLVEEQRIEWRVLKGGRYSLLRAGADGILKSRAFPGLWIDEAASLAG